MSWVGQFFGARHSDQPTGEPALAWLKPLEVQVMSPRRSYLPIECSSTAGHCSTAGASNGPGNDNAGARRSTAHCREHRQIRSPRWLRPLGWCKSGACSAWVTTCEEATV